MPTLPENRIFRLLLISSTIAVLLCYAWLTAHLLEPGFTVPGSIVSDAFVRTADSKLFLFEELFRSYPIEATRIDDELTELEPLINWLNPLKRTIELVVDEKVSDRILVTDTRIEIGRDILLSRGQLSKAVLKAWILQNASLEITSSHLRTEVASDVLLAMLKGDFELEVPGEQEALTFESNEKPWWTYADSYSGVCKSPWRSLELSALCENKSVKSDLVSVSALSFRAFLDARIWKSYMATSVTDRLPFVRRWAANLERARGLAKPTSKEGWLTVVQRELETMLPSSIDPLASERKAWLPKIEAPLIVIDGEGRVAAPGTLKISSTDLEFEHARMGVMTICEAPSLRDVLNLPVAVDRVVWRPECKERKTDFVQVRPSAIRIALDRGLAKGSDKLDAFVRQHRETAAAESEARMLGIATAKWDEQASAFQVHGALQAVESFRLKKN